MKALALLACLAACGGDDDGVRVKLDFSRAHGFYDAPFPSDDLTDISAFPNDSHVPLIDQSIEMVTGRGFATTGGVFFQLSTPIDPALLPDLAGSMDDDASVFLLALDDGTRAAVDVTFQDNGGPYGAPNLLALVPLQGRPLRPATRYAAVVTTAIAARAPAGAFDVYGDAIDDVAAYVDLATVAGLTVFTTGDPTRDVVDAVQDQRITVTGLALTDTFTDFCVFESTAMIPDYQIGEPPYESEGGALDLDAVHEEEGRVFVTLPRTPPPPGGYPVVVFSRTGAGGDRPLVDRGQQPSHGAPALEAGEGPGRYFARAGFAAIQLDGPLGGLRNPNGNDEQFSTFNVSNLYAMRDNVRESAIELAILTQSLGDVSFDATACAGAGATATFDTAHVALFGHSMGAWIAPLAAAAAPDIGAVILSGAGGSWIENVLYKTEPVAPLPFILVVVQESSLRADDPVLTLAQWALEPADPQVYGAALAGRAVLMEQGIVDDYMLPRIANSTSLAMGLDLAGDELDTIDDPRLAEQQPLGPLLPMSGGELVALPTTRDRVVVQHLEDGVENGHEVLFQLDGPKHQYQCFLASWAAGAASVPVDDVRDAPCP